MDAFTAKRITRFIEDFRQSTGVLPTLQDFEAHHFSRDLVESAVKKNLIELFYVTLTSGTIVKGYKIKTMK